MMNKTCLLKRIPIGSAYATYIDPTGAATADMLRRKAQTDQTFEPLPTDISFAQREKWWTRLREHYAVLRPGRHRPYVDHCEAHLSKIGRQGGMFSWSLMESLLMKYYNVPAYQHSRVISVGLQILLQEIDVLLQTTEPPAVYLESRGVTGTFAGLPTCATKGDFHAETLGMKHPSHLLSAIPGTRFMRNKPRIIFKDSVINVRQVERPLAAVRRWLAQHLPHLFGAWSNPRLHIHPAATECIRRRFQAYAFDYESMDTSVTLELVADTFFPVLEKLLGDQAIILEALITEMFDQSLFMGDELWTGRHTLFSGVAITNDAETVISVCVSLGILHELGLSRSHARIFALGDDLTLAIPGRLSSRFQGIEPLLHDIEATGLRFSRDESKTGLCQPDRLTFCRRVYYPAAPTDGEGIMYGAYPSCLVYNQIVHPEYLNRPAVEASARLQRLDNLQWSPDYGFVVALMRGLFPVKDLILAESPPRDWWQRLYGEQWNPESSPTFHYIMNKLHHDTQLMAGIMHELREKYENE